MTDAIIAETQTPVLLHYDLQPDEPDDWYRRFILYRDLGRSRTLGVAYSKTRVPHTPLGIPASWYDAFRAWDWRARATAYDEDQRATRQATLDAERKTDRDQRVLVLKAARGKLIEAMQKTNATDASYSQIVGDLTSLNEQLRKESET